MNNKINKNNKGITLVSLVITIIVMLILAGVSLSMVTGESSVLKQAQKTAFMQEMAGYKEELESEILGKSAEYYAKNLKHLDKTTITLAGNYMKEYIPSMKDEDIKDYMIVKGELYNIGNDEFELGICAELGYKTKEEGKSNEEFAGEIENLALEEIIKKMAGVSITYTDDKGEIKELGLKLAKKVASFGSTEAEWAVITSIENGETKDTYADDWYYVEAGQDVPGLGVLKSSYIINYKTNSAVKFDGTKHTILKKNGNLGVTGGLVYNADPTNMADGSAKSWGNAVLHGFENGIEYNADGTVKSGWTPTAFITDGVDDYVEMKIENANFNDGLTIEFYGKVPTITQNAGSYAGEVHFFSKGVSFRDGICLGYWNEKSSSSKDQLWFGYSGHRHWWVQNGIFDNVDTYITLTSSPSDPRGRVWINQEEITHIRSAGSCTWEKILSNLNNKDNGFIFGKGTDSTGDNYSKLHIYSIRIYNKALNDEERLANYNATIAYHDILVNGGNADNDNDGGESFDKIEQ